MGLADWFKKDEVLGSKVLVCGLGSRFESLVAKDGDIYRQFYPRTHKTLFRKSSELTRAIADSQHDIVHLFCDVSLRGTVSMDENESMSGTDLIAYCCNAGVKLLWVASDNRPEAYVQHFRARGKSINLVMTVTRNDPEFSEFLDKLLFRMSQGQTMPVAWADLSPQAPGVRQQHSMACIFWAARGAVKLR